MNPLVSYLIPFWNPNLKWFNDCLKSVEEQQYDNIEIVLVDDGTDGFDLIPKKKRFPVKLTSQPHSGIASALNKGLAIASGEFIARLDADDYSVSARTPIQVEFLQNNPEISILGGAMTTFGGACGVITPEALTHDEILVRMKTRCPFLHPTVMFRRHVYEAIGGYPEDYLGAEDYAYWARALKIFKGANLVTPLTWHRMHPDRESVRHFDAQKCSSRRIVKEVTA